MAFRFVRFENGVLKSSYDDSLMRKISIEVFEKGMGLKFMTGTETGIDLVLINNPIFGAEGEDGSGAINEWWFLRADRPLLR